jgi:hypothetical protein
MYVRLCARSKPMIMGVSGCGAFRRRQRRGWQTCANDVYDLMAKSPYFCATFMELCGMIRAAGANRGIPGAKRENGEESR